MGIDLSAMFDQAKAAAEQGMSDALKQGGNAAVGFLEKGAIDILNADKAKHEEEVKKSVKNTLDTPVKKGSFQDYLKNLATGPAMQSYGPYIIGAVGLVVVITLVMRGK